MERDELQKLHTAKIPPAPEPSKTPTLNVEAMLNDEIQLDLGNLFSTDGYVFELSSEEKQELEQRKQIFKDHIASFTKEAFGKAAAKIKEVQDQEKAEKQRMAQKRQRTDGLRVAHGAGSGG